MNYKLDVQLRITEVQCFDMNGAKVDAPVKGGYEHTMTTNGLSVNDTMDLGSMDFMEVCKVLGEMHTTIAAMKAAKQ